MRFVKFQEYSSGEMIWIAAEQVVSVRADGSQSTAIRTTVDREIFVAGLPDAVIDQLNKPGLIRRCSDA